jgi:Zn-dependent protease
LPIVTLVFFHTPILAARPVPFNPGRVRYGEFGAALIAAAGPLSNLVLALIASIILHLINSSIFIANALYLFISLNVALFIFNLVPIPPLDGSRVLYAFAPEPLQRLMHDIEPYGLFVIFGLVLLGGFGGVLATLNQSILQLLLW